MLVVGSDSRVAGSECEYRVPSGNCRWLTFAVWNLVGQDLKRVRLAFG
jgi:hypothetical protein